jgi:hypothetical protein
MHGPGRTEWKRERDSAKLANDDETKFAPFTRHFMGQLNSGVFLAFLEKLTGIEGLIPDPTFGSCGMHSTGRGGRLMMHTDVNRHPHGCAMHQVLNLILYLNEDWKEEYGGHLELWDEARKPVRKILPVANRVALFHTGTRSLHGHPHPLTCPPGRRRNSLAVYYYLRDRPATEDYAGMQRSVHWFPDREEDLQYARERTAKAVAELETLSGRAVGVTPAMIPFEVPKSVLDPRSGLVPLYFLRPEDIGDASTFVQRHARAALAHLGLSAAEFLAAYRPVAMLGVSSPAELSRPEAVLGVLHADGDMYVARGPSERELFWVGYLEEVLASVPRP